MSGILAGIAHRRTKGDPMIEINECVLVPGRGLDSEHRPAGRREVTLLSRQSWDDACHDLGTHLPWWTRRANFLIEGLDLSRCTGKTLVIGAARVHIHGESRPCEVMDQQHPGLRNALKPDCRGGAVGEVLVGCTVRVGDPVTVIDE